MAGRRYRRPRWCQPCRDGDRFGFGASIVPRAARFLEAGCCLDGGRKPGREKGASIKPHRRRGLELGPGSYRLCAQARERWPVRIGLGGRVVQPADEAAEGRLLLVDGQPSRGRAAHKKDEGRRAAPAVLLSTITYGLRRLSAGRSTDSPGFGGFRMDLPAGGSFPSVTSPLLN